MRITIGATGERPEDAGRVAALLRAALGSGAEVVLRMPRTEANRLLRVLLDNLGNAVADDLDDLAVALTDALLPVEG